MCFPAVSGFNWKGMINQINKRRRFLPLLCYSFLLQEPHTQIHLKKWSKKIEVRTFCSADNPQIIIIWHITCLRIPVTSCLVRRQVEVEWRAPLYQQNAPCTQFKMVRHHLIWNVWWEGILWRSTRARSPNDTNVPKTLKQLKQP